IAPPGRRVIEEEFHPVYTRGDRADSKRPRGEEELARAELQLVRLSLDDRSIVRIVQVEPSYYVLFCLRLRLNKDGNLSFAPRESEPVVLGHGHGAATVYSSCKNTTDDVLLFGGKGTEELTTCGELRESHAGGRARRQDVDEQNQRSLQHVCCSPESNSELVLVAGSGHDSD